MLLWGASVISAGHCINNQISRNYWPPRGVNFKDWTCSCNRMMISVPFWEPILNSSRLTSHSGVITSLETWTTILSKLETLTNCYKYEHRVNMRWTERTYHDNGRRNLWRLDASSTLVQTRWIKLPVVFLQNQVVGGLVEAYSFRRIGLILFQKRKKIQDAQD
jgi:hypothetical protein